MEEKIIQLTDKLQVSNGGHILYCYDSLECYINNAVSYIHTGIERGHHVMVIDCSERFKRINERLKEILTEEQLKKVYFEDTVKFYGVNGEFDGQTIIDYFGQLIRPFVQNEISLRTWAHVEWKEQAEIEQKITDFESLADCTLDNTGMISVCAYNANDISASLHMEMLRKHEYFMTDHEIVRSNLYQNTYKTVIFPSLSVQSQIQSEMDLYKQKLDFVHVVSHEVRNPLTVIKAYSNLLLNLEPELSQKGRNKLHSIADYVEIIDNEMQHIIHTEQMLSNDLLWENEVINPLRVCNEVIRFMRIKSRIQNIQFRHILDLDGDERLLNNNIGFKLILSNLISNAIKYSEENTQVLVSAETDNQRMYITVKDEGAGMNEKQIGKLFVKYAKMNGEKSGQGIGLYMVKKLLDYFQGNINVESKPNQGTQVNIDLPLAQEVF